VPRKPSTSDHTCAGGHLISSHWGADNHSDVLAWSMNARLERIGCVASQQLLKEPVLRLELGDQLVECGVLPTVAVSNRVPDNNFAHPYN
jgi:hypothetical protein